MIRPNRQGDVLIPWRLFCLTGTRYNIRYSYMIVILSDDKGLTGAPWLYFLFSTSMSKFKKELFPLNLVNLGFQYFQYRNDKKFHAAGLRKWSECARCAVETLSIKKILSVLSPYDRQQRQQTITSAQLKNQKNSTCVCLMGPSTRSNRNNNKNNNSNNNNNESHPQELNDYNFHPGAPVVVPTTNYQLLLLFVESNPTRDTHIVSRKNPTIRFCSNLL